jgi:hypothetical protein
MEKQSRKIEKKVIQNILIKIIIFICLLFVFSKWNSIEEFIRNFFNQK